MSTPDFFRRLDAMIDFRYPLAALANRMSWKSIESAVDTDLRGACSRGPG
jgi:hypothetical protein